MYLSKKLKNYELLLSPIELHMLIRCLSGEEVTDAEDIQFERMGNVLFGSREKLMRIEKLMHTR